MASRSPWRMNSTTTFRTTSRERPRERLEGASEGAPSFFGGHLPVKPSDFIADFFNASTGSIYLCSLPNDRNGGRPAEICGRGEGARLDELVLHHWDKNDRGTFF